MNVFIFELHLSLICVISNLWMLRVTHSICLDRFSLLK